MTLIWTLVVSVAGVALMLGGLLAGEAIVGAASAHTQVADTVVGIETHINPFGDRFVMVRAENMSYGLWLTDACAATLSLGSQWPSAAPECAH